MHVPLKSNIFCWIACPSNTITFVLNPTPSVGLYVLQNLFLEMYDWISWDFPTAHAPIREISTRDSHTSVPFLPPLPNILI